MKKSVGTKLFVWLSCFAQGIVAGVDATEVFFGLHRYEVLEKPQYKRLQIGSVEGEEQQIYPRAVGALSKVPYGEPTWLTDGYFSPYYKEVSLYVLAIFFHQGLRLPASPPFPTCLPQFR